MQHAATDMSFARGAKASPQRFVTVAIVGVIHLLAIYTLLVAFTVVPLPVPPGTILDYVKVPTPPPPSTPQPKVNVPSHVNGPIAIEPKFTIDNGPGVITNPPPIQPRTGTQAFGARLVVSPIPPYPLIDVRLGHEGVVSLKLSVDASGAVIDAVVTKSSGFDSLDAEAVAWVKAKWRYKPAMQSGQAVASTTFANVRFELKNR
jgi:protein TonB